MKKFNSCFFMLFIIFILVSCSKGNETKSKIRPEWLENWLANSECLLSCWNGIYPGITEIIDAEAIVKRDNEMVIVQELSDNTSNGKSCFHFGTQIEGEVVPSGWVCAISKDDDRVGQIMLVFDNQGYPTYGELNSAFGSPSQYYIANGNPRGCYLSAIYQNGQAWVALYGKTISKNKIQVSGNTIIARISIYSPGYDDYFNNADIQNVELVKWDESNIFPCQY